MAEPATLADLMPAQSTAAPQVAAMHDLLPQQPAQPVAGMSDLIPDRGPHAPMDNVQLPGGAVNTLTGLASGAYNTIRSLALAVPAQIAGLADIPVHAAGTAMGYKPPEPSTVQSAVADFGATHPSTRAGENASQLVQEGAGDILGAPGRAIRWLAQGTDTRPVISDPDTGRLINNPNYGKPIYSQDEEQTIENVGNAAALPALGVVSPRALLARATEAPKEAPEPRTEPAQPVQPEPAPSATRATEASGANAGPVDLSDLTPASVAPTESADAGNTTASIPVMITRAMRSRLSGMGYTDADIAKMTPQDAHAALSASSGTPAGDSAPLSLGDLQPQARPAPASRSALDPTKDTLLTAVAKLGGVDKEQAQNLGGLDPADIAKAPGSGILRPIHSNGLPLDRMAEILAQHDYPVLDENGNYDPRVLIERMRDEMNGKPTYSAQGADAAAEAAYTSHQSDMQEQYGLDVNRPAELPPDLVEGAQGGFSLPELAQRARSINPAAADEALQAGSDAQAASKLWQIVAQARTRGGASLSDSLTGFERRQNPGLRKTFDQMTPQEQRQAFYTSEKTGLPNGRAYAEAPHAPAVAALDADSLKFVNDNMGHAAGDELLQRIGSALKNEGLQAYHVSGDEFVVQGDSPKALDAALSKVKDALASRKITAGEHSVTPEISWGVSNKLSSADALLSQSKQSREAAGLRAARGEMPSSYEGPLRSASAPPKGAKGGKTPAPATPDLDTLNSAEDIKAALDKMAAANAGRVEAFRRGVMPQALTRQLANALGMTEADLLKRPIGQAMNAEQAVASRDLLTAAMDDLQTKSRGVDSTAKLGGKATLEDRTALRTAIDRYQAIREQVLGLQAESGRALQSFKIEAKAARLQSKAIDNILRYGKHDDVEDLAKQIASLDDPAQVAAYLEQAKKATIPQMLREVYINSLLTLPSTHLKNILSNTFNALWSIPETATAAALGKLHGGDKVYFREALARAQAMTQAHKDAFRLANKSFRDERVAEELGKIEFGKAIPGKLGKIVRIPGRMVLWQDALLKAYSYRQEVSAQAIRTGIEKGLKLGSPEMAEYTRQFMESPPLDTQLAAQQNAAYKTFTRALQEGTVGKKFADLVYRVPGSWLILPFVRTPWNIMTFIAERTPFGLAMKSVRADIAKGGAARDNAAARMILGTGAGAVVVSYALQGKITGQGPLGRDEKQTWLLAGNQPYSIKVGDKWYAYNNGIEPAGGIIGLAADFTDIGQHATGAEREQMAAMISHSLGNNLFDRAWLSPISDMVGAFEDPERYGDSFARNFVAGLASPPLLNGVAHVEDPVLRQAHTMLDAIKARIPGQSQTLEPKLDLWGNPIMRQGSASSGTVQLSSPIKATMVGNDPVGKEMLRLGVNVDPPGGTLQGVKLTDAQYNQYVKMAGQPAHALLLRMIASPLYQRASDIGKMNIVRAVIMHTRAQAGKAMEPIIGPQAIVQAKLTKLGVQPSQ